MVLDDLPWRDIATSCGVTRLWTAQATSVVGKPVVLAIGAHPVSMDDLAKLATSLGILTDSYVMQVPRDLASPDGAGLAAVTDGLKELIETAFVGRPVVILGFSLGALVALTVRAANVARVVAVEPALDSSSPSLTKPDSDAIALQADVSRNGPAEAFGVGESTASERHLDELIANIAYPVDLIVGAASPPPRQGDGGPPSFMGAEARRRFARSARIRLHASPRSGHDMLRSDPAAISRVVLEACRRAAAPRACPPSHLDEVLLEATPISSGKLLYWGPNAAAFADAFLSSSPKAELDIADETSEGGPPNNGVGEYDTVVLGATPPPSSLARLTGALAYGGHLIARWGDEQAGIMAALAPLDLRLREPVGGVGNGVVRAQKCRSYAMPRPALHLQIVAYAELLMDVRTRLPARGLASDPALRVRYGGAPMQLPELPRDAPKVLVLQRLAETRPEVWRNTMARLIREGWVVVVEYDDHPLLIAEMGGHGGSEADMIRFGFAHAVQTTTPSLVEAFSAHNPEVAMFPNSAFDLPPFIDGERPHRVFYGAVRRGAYPAQIAASLSDTIARWPDTRFDVVGDQEVFRALPTRSKVYHPYLTFEAYLALMSQCSVSLSPIEALPRRNSKSDAKYVDAARSGALTIASPTIYDQVIEHGVNGLLAPRIEDWAPLLTDALADQARRSRMARRAWEDVRDRRMFAYQAPARRDWYLDLWARREALTEGVLQRLPGLREALG